MVEWMISSSVLIVFVTAMRYFFRKRLPMRAWYALWLVVAVRLLVPVSFAESGLSILNLFAFTDSAQDRQDLAGQQEDAGGEARPATDGVAAGENGRTGNGHGAGLENQAGTGLQETGLRKEGTQACQSGETAGQAGAEETDIMADALTAPGRVQEPETGSLYFQAATQASGGGSGEDTGTGSQGTGHAYPAWQTFFAGHSLLWYIWLLGVAVCAGCVLTFNGKYRRKVRISRRRCKAAAQSRLPVYVSPVVDNPCMFGLARPAVYLSPEAAQRPEALKYVLCHENVHYSHRDNLWVVVRAACLCLHWYNPLVWIAAALSEQDGELACDERTLELLGQEERIRYGRALLDFSAQGSTWQRGWKLSTAMSSGKKLLKERLLVIVGEPRRHAGALAGVMLLTALCMAATFTGRVSGQEPEGDTSKTTPEDAAFDGTGSGKESAPSTDGAESTAIVSVKLEAGKEHVLKISGEAMPGSSQYRIDQIELNWVHDRMEETMQTIRPEDMRVLYTRPLEEIRSGGGQMYSYTSDEEPCYAKPLVTAEGLPAHEVGKFLADRNGQIFSDAPDGGLVVADLNFDGYQDFCLRDGTGDTVNVPYYCYLWNPAEGRFEPGYMIPNVEVDQEARLIRSATDDGTVQRSVKYYRFDESNVLHMVRYVEENQTPDAVFPTLDLTYCETEYGLPAVDEWDYGTRYGGALTERFVYWAKEALTELYEWSGTKIDKACFMVTRFGDFCFANTPEELKASLIYYDRVYGEKAGFESCIEQMGVVTERTVWFSPVIQWNKPENLDEMTVHELAEWYFERSPLAEGEKLASVEGIGEGIGYNTDSIMNIMAESGNFYQIYMNRATGEMSAMYGPYDYRPD